MGGEGKISLHQRKYRIVVNNDDDDDGEEEGEERKSICSCLVISGKPELYRVLLYSTFVLDKERKSGESVNDN